MICQERLFDIDWSRNVTVKNKLSSYSPKNSSKNNNFDLKIPTDVSSFTIGKHKKTSMPLISMTIFYSNNFVADSYDQYFGTKYFSCMTNWTFTLKLHSRSIIWQKIGIENCRKPHKESKDLDACFSLSLKSYDLHEEDQHRNFTMKEENTIVCAISEAPLTLLY